MSADLAHVSFPPPTGKEGKLGKWWSGAVTGDVLDARVFPPLTYLIEDVLTEGGLGMLAGPPKAGKSYLSYGIACAVADPGMVALGKLKVSAHGHVLIVSLDDQSQQRAQRRLREVMHGKPIPADITLHTEANLGRGPVAADSLISYINNRPDTRLIVIDTLEHLRPTTGGGSNIYTEDVRFLGDLRRVIKAHPNVSILVLAHTRKGDKQDPDDPISAVSGSHGVTGGVDAILVLTGTRGAPRRKLDVVSRDGQDKALVLTFTDNGLIVTEEDPNDPTINLTPDDAEVYRMVQEWPKGISAADLKEFLPKITKIGNRLGSLERDGYITKTARGVYAP